MCYTKCLNNDAGTHMYDLCVCACVYALQEDRSLSLPLMLSPLEDDICTRCCHFNFEAPFHQEPPKQQILQIYREFCNGIKPIKDLGSYNIRYTYHEKETNLNLTRERGYTKRKKKKSFFFLEGWLNSLERTRHCLSDLSSLLFEPKLV